MFNNSKAISMCLTKGNLVILPKRHHSHIRVSVLKPIIQTNFVIPFNLVSYFNNKKIGISLSMTTYIYVCMVDKGPQMGKIMKKDI